MKVVTGACGFIGSCFVSFLNDNGHQDIIIVDDFSDERKNINIQGKQYKEKIHRDDFVEWMNKNKDIITELYHIGARTDTTESSIDIFNKLNLNYSKSLWKICADNDIPFIYASSAATYGNGEAGYDDSHNKIKELHPLNAYGVSKNEFDKWVLKQDNFPKFWAGFKFFNVYGPNEYHKTRMASVVFHTFNSIMSSNQMQLFRSHNRKYKDGEQLRDFIYVKDIIKVIYSMMINKSYSGIYNLGTGNARTFNDLVFSVFHAMRKDVNISFIDTPEDIRDQYQYYTQAKMKKLREIGGYNTQFYSLEEGVSDYVNNYLIPDKFL